MSDWRPDSMVVTSRLVEALNLGLSGQSEAARRALWELLNDFPETASDWDVVGHHYAIVCALLEGLVQADPSLRSEQGILRSEYGYLAAPGVGLDPVGAPEELGLVAAMIPAYVNSSRDGLIEVFVNAGPKVALRAMELLFAITIAVLLAKQTSR